MASKKPATRARTTIRFNESDYALFAKAAELEGLEGDILKWLLSAGRKRARLLTSKGPVRVTEVMVPPPEQTRVEPKP